jgi:hypothetical protein
VDRTKAMWRDLVVTGRTWQLLAALALLAFVVDEPEAGIPVAGLVIAALALLLGAQRWSRHRARARRAAMPYGTGVWPVRVEPARLVELYSGGLGLAWLVDAVSFELHVSGEALHLLPTPLTRFLGRVRPLELRWTDVARVSAGKPLRTLRGRSLLVPLTPVTLLLVGGVVPELYRPVSDEEAVGLGLDHEERLEIDAENAADGRADFGDDYVLGTYPLQVLVDDVEGLVEAAARYTRGVLPAGQVEPR